MKSDWCYPNGLDLDGGRLGSDRLWRRGSRKMWVGSPDIELGPREFDFNDEERGIYIHLTQVDGLVAVSLNEKFLTALYDEESGRLVSMEFELGRFLKTNTNTGEQAFAAEVVKEVETKREQGVNIVLVVNLVQNEFYMIYHQSGQVEEIGRRAFEEAINWDGDPVEMKVAVLTTPYEGIKVGAEVNDEDVDIYIEAKGGDGAHFSMGKAVDFTSLGETAGLNFETGTEVLKRMFPTLKF